MKMIVMGRHCKDCGTKLKSIGSGCWGSDSEYDDCEGCEMREAYYTKHIIVNHTREEYYNFDITEEECIEKLLNLLRKRDKWKLEDDIKIDQLGDYNYVHYKEI